MTDEEREDQAYFTQGTPLKWYHAHALRLEVTSDSATDTTELGIVLDNGYTLLLQNVDGDDLTRLARGRISIHAYVTRLQPNPWRTTAVWEVAHNNTIYWNWSASIHGRQPQRVRLRPTQLRRI